LTGFRLLLLAALLALPGAGAAADPAVDPSADPAVAARAAYRRGADLYKAGKYREAIAQFEAADRLKPSPALQFNIGQSWEKLGDHAAALASFARYLRLDPAAPNRESVQRSVKTLEARLAATGRQMLHVTTDPPGADLSVDGAAAGQAPLDAAYPPGPHSLAAAAPGRRTTQREVVLFPLRSLEVNLVLEPGQDPASASALAAQPPAPPMGATLPDPAPQPVERKSWLGPIIAGSVGVVAAGAGIVMGLQARSAQNALLAGGNDRSQADALASKAQGDATAANVLYGVAGAAVLTGGVLAIAF
jgi:tetratricopeptide (TPR) repeat protein